MAWWSPPQLVGNESSVPISRFGQDWTPSFAIIGFSYSLSSTALFVTSRMSPISSTSALRSTESFLSLMMSSLIAPISSLIPLKSYVIVERFSWIVTICSSTLLVSLHASTTSFVTRSRPPRFERGWFVPHWQGRTSDNRFHTRRSWLAIAVSESGTGKGFP